MGPAGCVTCSHRAYTPKVVATPFRNQVIELAVSRLLLLRPLRALRCYAERTRAFRQSDQLFVCFGAHAKGRPLSKPSLAEAIVLSYKSLSLDPRRSCMRTLCGGSLLSEPY